MSESTLVLPAASHAHVKSVPTENIDAVAQAAAAAGTGPAFLPPFSHSKTGSMGIELELMVLDRLTYDLLPAAPEILRLLALQKKDWMATPEITTSMLEVATSVLNSYAEAASQIEEMRTSVLRAAFQVGAAISGGGAHPFQKWSDQRIYPKERYRNSAKKFGYLTKLFTVFGMHVHIGVESADEAIRLCAWLTQRAPLFIALSANSPCWQGENTGFCSARSNVVGAFPMSGVMPSHIRSWAGFERHFSQLAGHGIVHSIKDFYWDVRPKPEYGTIRRYDRPSPRRWLVTQENCVLSFSIVPATGPHPTARNCMSGIASMRPKTVSMQSGSILRTVFRIRSPMSSRATYCACRRDRRTRILARRATWSLSCWLRADRRAGSMHTCRQVPV